MTKHKYLSLLISIIMALRVNAQNDGERIKKNYFILGSSLFVNEASLNSEKSHITGSGHSFTVDYRRLIMNNDKGSIYALIGLGDYRLGYTGWIDNNGVNENFNAIERYSTLKGGFVGSLKSKQNPLDFLDLEMTFVYWRLNNQEFSVNGSSKFPRADSRLSIMFYPHYSRLFDNVKLCIGPFANIDLAEFNEVGRAFDLALIGLRLNLGVGF